MLKLKWLTHQSDKRPVKIENYVKVDIDDLFSDAVTRLPEMKLGQRRIAADGFVILNHHDQELRRWFSGPRPQSIIAFPADRSSTQRQPADTRLQQNGGR